MARLIIATAALFLAVTTGTAQAQSLLMRGDTGPEVRQWQQQLNLDEVPGADIRADGISGPVTENKTQTFQRWRGITVDGIVGPESRSAMREAFRATSTEPEDGEPDAGDRPLLARGSTGPAVQTWQGRLNEWLSTARPEKGQLAEDGIYGPKTEAATTDLQQAADITVDGIVGPDTRSALAEETGEV